MSAFNRIATAEARAALAVARRIGFQVQYQNRRADPVTIWVRPRAATVSLADIVNISSVETKQNFIIAQQTNFPPENGVQPNDLIFIGDIQFRVISHTDNNGFGSVFNVEAQRVQARTAKAK